MSENLLPKKRTLDDVWSLTVESYREIADSCGNGKYNFIHHALKGDINIQRLDDICQKVRRRCKDVDMDIIILVRLLFLFPEEYLKQSKGKYVLNKITSVLDDFPYWPSNFDAHLSGAEALCFWSENHTLMLLSSAHLYRQWRRKMSSSSLGVYTATNVVNGGIIREDDNVLHISSLGSSIHALKKQDTGIEKSTTDEIAEKSETVEEDKFLETKNVMRKGTSSPQKEKVLATLNSLASYYKSCEQYWSQSDSGKTSELMGGKEDSSCSSKGGEKYDNLSDVNGEGQVEGTSQMISLSGAALEEALLHSYINSHVQFDGMFEVNSHVYIPYTISALLNLIDFSEDIELVRLASRMINIALKTLMLCTTDKNVSTLSVSTRAFPRTRCRVHGHNVNQILNFVLGKSPDNINPTIITDFLATTKWRPSSDLFKYHEFNGRIQYQASPSLSLLKTAFPGIPEAEVTPFFWSAGLLVHPDFVHMTKDYISLKNIHSNETLWPLRLISAGLASPIASWFERLSRGQLYADVLVNVYKRNGGLCMSSFENFNVGKAGFQQLPWCVNLDGIGIWSESGSIGSSFGGFLLTNTYNPHVVQRGGLLVCSYSAPRSFQSILGISSNAWAHIVWPFRLFDDQRTYEMNIQRLSSGSEAKKEWVVCSGTSQDTVRNSWRVASRNQCYIGLGCFQASRVRPAYDNKQSMTDQSNTKIGEGLKMFYDGDNFTIASRIICKDMHNLFVVVVAAHDEYDFDFDKFINRCLCISVYKDVDRHGNVVVSITDPEEGSFSVKSGLE